MALSSVDSLRSSTGWVNQPFHCSGRYKVSLLYPVPVSWNFWEPHLCFLSSWLKLVKQFNIYGRSLILPSLPSPRKQAEKLHQWDLMLDIPISILGFIFQCFGGYAMMAKITLAKLIQPKSLLVLSWSNLSFLFNTSGWHMLALQKGY